MSKGTARQAVRTGIVETLEPRKLLAIVTGVLYYDRNANHVFDSSEAPYTQSQVRVFLDANANGVADTGERSVFVGQEGRYSFTDVSGGNYVIGTYSSDRVELTGVSPTVAVLNGSADVTVPDVGVRRYSSYYFNVMHDVNGDGVWQSQSDTAGPAGTWVWADFNNNSQRDVGEPAAQFQRAGNAEIRLYDPGTYVIRAAYPAGWSQTGRVALQAPASFATDSTITLTDGTYSLYGSLFFLSRPQAGSLSGFAFLDEDGNGAKDRQETGADLFGVNAYLDLDSDGIRDADEPVQYLATNAGWYCFTGLQSRAYTVRFADASGVTLQSYRRTTPAADQTFELTPTARVVAADTGLERAHRIAGFVYDDRNMNGVRDTGENALLSGQTVYVDTNNNAVRDINEPTFVTHVDGFWFSLAAGTYTLRLDTTPGWTQSQPASGNGYTVTVGPSLVAPLYFGTYETPQGYFRGAVFRDENANGVRDSGEAGLQGARVYNDANNNGVWDVTSESSGESNSTGAYAVAYVGAGTYRLRQVLQPGWTQTTPVNAGAHVITISSTGSIEGLNFGSVSSTPPPPVPTTLQSELATLSGGTGKATSHAGFTGTGYADYAGQNSAVTYSITRGSAGSGKLEFRYANGSAANRPLQVLVNNVVVGTVACAPTGGWTNWANVSLNNVALPAGNVAIKVLASTTAGGANVDSLTITASDTVTPPPPPPTTGTDLALNKTTTASTIQASGNAAAKATDGSATTRWSSTYADSQWLQVDLGSANVITGVRLAWEAAFGKSYKIQGSNNASSWTDLYSTTTGDGGVDTINITNTTAWRYVRMLGLTRATKYGFSLFDFNVYGVGGTPPVDPPPVDPPPVDPPPATTGSIGGFLFWDTNKNGKYDTGDTYQAGKVVFIDLDGDNVLDSNEKKLTTDANGKFNFTGLAAGTYKVRRVVPSGYKVTTAPANITITAGQVFSNVAIGSINA